MAEYVVDASVVIESLVQGPFTLNAKALFAQKTSLDTLIVPEFCLLECANVLWKHVRFQGLSQATAENNVKDLRALPLRRTPVKRLLDSALAVGLKHRLAVYDSVYIILAKRLGYPLISADQPQIRAASAEGITLIPITHFQP